MSEPKNKLSLNVPTQVSPVPDSSSQGITPVEEFSIEEFSIMELEDRFELVGRCNRNCECKPAPTPSPAPSPTPE